MLDQLLLRAAGSEASGGSRRTSLQYLVLDEFHTYDGAQGTDVAMLLRRLGLTLKSHWPDDDARITAEDRARPLGRITAGRHLGDPGRQGRPGCRCLSFAGTVFGEPFDDDAVVTESRSEPRRMGRRSRGPHAARGSTAVDVARLDVAAINAAVDRSGTTRPATTIARTVLGILYEGDLADGRAVDADLLLDLAGPPAGRRPWPLRPSDAVDPQGTCRQDGRIGRVASIPRRHATLGNSFGACGRGARPRSGPRRAGCAVGRGAPVGAGAEPHRPRGDSTAQFRWGDDGPPAAGADADEIRPSFPALYCRHCGRSGWGVGLAPVGTSLAVDDEAIRRDHASREGRFRALIYAPAEADAAYAERRTAGRSPLVLGPRPGAAGRDAGGRRSGPAGRLGAACPDHHRQGRRDQPAKDDTCPSCGQVDGIRFLGSAIATLLSVSLVTLFGSATLDRAEKKALVFTDSVQDAAHRAGFVQARSHTLTLRAVLRDAVADGSMSLDELVGEDRPPGRRRSLCPVPHPGPGLRRPAFVRPVLEGVQAAGCRGERQNRVRRGLRWTPRWSSG